MHSENSQEETQSRFLVGIDLGTTNSAVAFIDTEATDTEKPVSETTNQDTSNWQVQSFSVPQLVAPSELEARDTLPSFHYEPAESEFPANALDLAWSHQPPTYAIGFFARDHGAKVPSRMISSAKSWLCHSGVDRTSNLLPWHGAEDVERLSPVKVTARILGHIRDAWNHRFPDHPLESQDLVITLPASFDEVARELTVKAAAEAGLRKIVLLEEPQAAFYAWINAFRDDWSAQVHAGQKILVCDIGGGTTDFTLIRVRSSEDGKVQFHRVAVGDHLILGGDNLDLALAHHLEQRLSPNGKLKPHQWAVLVRNCRHVKETLLGENPPEKMTVNVPGGGSKLIGGSLQVEVTQQEVFDLLVEGFLPQTTLDEQPSTRQSGFQEFGLPYAADHAITKYLSHFLTTHRHAGDQPNEAEENQPGNKKQDKNTEAAHDPARPDIVLFNGGLFESNRLRGRLLDVLQSWFSNSQKTDSNANQEWNPIVLKNERLDLAVARGAAYYGMVRRGVGVRIAAGLPRTYYIGITDEQQQAKAICLLPAGIEEGQSVELSQREFELLIRQPVEFPLYVSSTRLTDSPGEILPFEAEQMTALPPIRTVIRAGKKNAPAASVHVHLHAKLTEIGTVELGCSEVDGKGAWRLQFDVRSATHTEIDAQQTEGESQGVLDDELMGQCTTLIEKTFAEVPEEQREVPKHLVKTLEAITELPRLEWPPTFLRGLWELLMEHEQGRKLSPQHEARWLNLLGFSLRPGYGLAVDDWRVAQTWRLFQSKKVIHANVACRIELPILWRRIAGGLNAGQQSSLVDPLLPALRPIFKGKRVTPKKQPKHKNKKGNKAKESIFSCGSHETAELWRLLGSLEHLSSSLKIDLGNALLRMIPHEETGAVRDAQVWALGRIGARVPMYGSLNAVPTFEIAEKWIQQLLDVGYEDPVFLFALVQLARKTNDRYRDVSENTREQVLAFLKKKQSPKRYLRLVREGGELGSEDQEFAFGESLPQGLRMK